MAGTTPRAGPRRGRGWLLADGYARHPGDAVRLVAGCVVLLLTALAIHKNYVGSRETAVFRASGPSCGRPSPNAPTGT
jgi:hypothetical protein